MHVHQKADAHLREEGGISDRHRLGSDVRTSDPWSDKVRAKDPVDMIIECDCFFLT